MTQCRRCPRCGESKPLDAFSGTYCRPCFAAYMRQRRGSPELVTKPCEHCGNPFRQQRANSKHCSRKCFYADRYLVRREASSFKTERSAYARKYHRENRPARLAAGARWRAANPERFREMQQAWAARNKYTYKNTWRTRHPERHAAKQRIRTTRLRELTPFPVDNDLVLAKIAYWGGRCWICGCDYEAVDHVKPIAKRGLNIVANMRPICKSCNSRKRDRWYGVARLARLAALIVPA